MNIKETAYKLWDIATLRKGTEKHISGFSLRLPVRYSKYFPQDYELENFKFLEKYCVKGSVVVDVGAHIGLFAVRAAQLAGGSGKIYAFEPAPKTNDLLLKTIQINAMENIIEPRSEAVAEREGSTYFNVSDIEGDNSNSLVEYRQDKHLNKVEVRIVSLDGFIASRQIKQLDFIKIDAEGYEHRVLKGAITTLGSLRPMGILALHPKGIISNGDSLEEIYDLLKRLNYKLIYGGKELSREEFYLKKDLFDVHLMP